MGWNRQRVLLAVLILITAAFAGCTGTPGGDDGGDGDGGDQNQEPSAFFIMNCQHLDCSFDGSDSQDGDGTITAYEWDLGDGTTATGALTSHTYSAAGTYTVKLTVTDDEGATAETRRQLTVTAAPDNGTNGDDDDDPDPPEDYGAHYNGSVTPEYEMNWTFPVEFWQDTLIHVRYNITGQDFPVGVFNNVTVNLTNPAGTEVRTGIVWDQEPVIEWNVTTGATIAGNWTINATGNGLGNEDLGGTTYDLIIDVEYT